MLLLLLNVYNELGLSDCELFPLIIIQIHRQLDANERLFTRGNPNLSKIGGFGFYRSCKEHLVKTWNRRFDTEWGAICWFPENCNQQCETINAPTPSADIPPAFRWEKNTNYTKNHFVMSSVSTICFCFNDIFRTLVLFGRCPMCKPTKKLHFRGII